MALERAIHELSESLDRLHSQATNHLLWVIQNGKPVEPGRPPQTSSPAEGQAAGSIAAHYLVGMIEDRVTETTARTEELRAAARNGLQSEASLAAAARRLADVQSKLQELLLFSAAELCGHERVDELRMFGSEHGDAWEGWVENGIIEIDRFQESLLNTFQAILPCWQELAERLSVPTMLIESGSHGRR